MDTKDRPFYYDIVNHFPQVEKLVPIKGPEETIGFLL